MLTGWDSDWKSYCCLCYYQNQQKRNQEYSTYQQVYQQKFAERQKNNQQLQLLKKYLGCKKCGSLAVDAYSLYENSQLICQPCRMKKEGGSSSPISFLEQGKWFKRFWKIDLVEWLENYGCLPVNNNCADEWLRDKGHLENCRCLEAEARKLYSLVKDNLRRYQEKLKDCQCKISEKVRVDDDHWTSCESCGEGLAVASKKRVIRNRNDPKFWGINVREKVLCGNCLTNYQNKMPANKKYTFRKYLKRGYF
ncbi:MAG: hypothetical protein MRERV_3c030 [Mycoplasmataceae bacterium RV_VA103A]|nr:MAG: hypothetical protein MRERV_3c030 [Mycoplasmataceae bacterium RV_VA103A]